jgi:hypothetical protein
LHHTSFPDWLAGGFADPEFGPRYLAFLTAFARRYPWISRYTIINEPFVTAWFCGQCAVWHPRREGSEGFVPMLLAVSRTICEASALLTELVPGVRFLHAESCEGHSALDEDYGLFSKPDLDGGELDKGEIARGQLVIAGRDAAELFQPADQALHHVALAIENPVHEPGCLLRLKLRDDSTDPATPEIVSRRLTGVASVTHDRSRPQLWPART